MDIKRTSFNFKVTNLVYENTRLRVGGTVVVYYMARVEGSSLYLKRILLFIIALASCCITPLFKPWLRKSHKPIET